MTMEVYKKPRKVLVHSEDLPASVTDIDSIAVDTETMGLRVGRDRLCLVQLCAGDGICHLVQVKKYKAPHLVALLEDPKILKIFHFARFDIATVRRYLGADCRPVYCTRTASKLVRTYTERHGLRELCREILGVDISKQQQSSDWGAEKLTDAQCSYAAQDVLHLHRLRDSLDRMLEREGRQDLAQACFDFLPDRVRLDLAGWEDEDIFAH